jgi:RNA polymerase sigma factor (sigma-70 family)
VGAFELVRSLARIFLNNCPAVQGLSDGERDAEADLESEVRAQLAAGTLDSLLATLDSRESNIMRLRFGLNSEKRSLPRAEIAAAYGLTVERIRQLEEGALRKLAAPWRRRFLEQVVDDLL